MQAASRTQLPTAGVPTSVQRQRSGDRMRVSFSLPKTPDSPHVSPLSTTRATPTPAWRAPAHSPSGEPSTYPPNRSFAAKTPPSPARPLARTPPGGTQAATIPSQLSGEASMTMQKSRSWQSPPGSSTLAARPGLGPVISPSKSKVVQTATPRQAAYGVIFIRSSVKTHTNNNNDNKIHKTEAKLGRCRHRRRNLFRGNPQAARRSPLPRSSSCRAARRRRRTSFARCATYRRRRRSCRPRSNL